MRCEPEVQARLTAFMQGLQEASDPVGGGLVESVARPGGNVTGFRNLEAEDRRFVRKMIRTYLKIARRSRSAINIG